MKTFTFAIGTAFVRALLSRLKPKDEEIQLGPGFSFGFTLWLWLWHTAREESQSFQDIGEPLSLCLYVNSLIQFVQNIDWN